MNAAASEIAAPQPGPSLLRAGFIVGPTGAGKTAFAIELAERLEAEIVNADSRQLYRGLDIGTAKPTPEERRHVPHHLVDVRAPDEAIDVAEFARMARAAMAEIASRGRHVLVVGGSGLYLRVIRAGICPGPPAAPQIRAELSRLAACEGVPALHERLREVDYDAALRISPNDLKRIVRALEVFRLSGIPISVHQKAHRFASHDYETLTIGLTLPRAQLYAAIDRRFDSMIAAGLVDEVRGLIAAGPNAGAALLDTIGYREIAAFLRGEMELAAAIEQAKRRSRHLAKRQLTWFRAEPGIIWLDPRDGIEESAQLLGRFFSREDRDG
jgi:tRNA dimethylallyltransferase